jgi:hypothetical protein
MIRPRLRVPDQHGLAGGLDQEEVELYLQIGRGEPGPLLRTR